MEEMINHFEKFIKYLMNVEGCANINDEPEHAIFRHLISMMGAESFNRAFKHFFVEKQDFDEGFHDFHKSMRQNDFYPYDELEGSLDMVFWNFISMSSVPHDLLKDYICNNIN